MVTSPLITAKVGVEQNKAWYHISLKGSSPNFVPNIKRFPLNSLGHLCFAELEAKSRDDP